MTPDELRAAAYSRFNANWSDATVQIHYEGNPFTEPAPGTEWIRVAVRNLGGGQSTLGQTGSRKYDRVFAVVMQVFVPIDEGMKQGAMHAQAARAIFEGVRLDDEAWMYDGTISEQALRDGAKSRQINVEVSGVYLETK